MYTMCEDVISNITKGEMELYKRRVLCDRRRAICDKNKVGINSN
jgi:hypothetical protein